MLAELPGALALALLTAGVTMILVLILSATVGASSRDQAAATRCYAAQSVNMLRDVIAQHPEHDRSLLDQYPKINTEGLLCAKYLRDPLDEQSAPR